MKAVEDAERQALAEVPDPTELIQSPMPTSFIPQVPQASTQVVQQTVQTESSISKEDIIAIRSQLERVNATLTKMSGMLGKVFNTFNEKNRNNQQD
jgi:hypothetical protein